MGANRSVLVRYRNILGRRTLGISTLREIWVVTIVKLRKVWEFVGGDRGKGGKNCMGEGELEVRTGHFGVIWGSIYRKET